MKKTASKRPATKKTVATKKTSQITGSVQIKLPNISKGNTAMLRIERLDDGTYVNTV